MKWGKKILLVYHLKINVIKINNEFIEYYYRNKDWVGN